MGVKKLIIISTTSFPPFPLFFRLKQRYPDVFTDLCLYSEVCLLMTKYSFRLSSRRFIQELFMDVNFDALYEEPCIILKLDEAGGGAAAAAGPGASPAHKPLSQLPEVTSDENLAVKK